MTTTPVAPRGWTDVHDLALLYVAVAYGTDYELSDAEQNAIRAALQAWELGLTDQQLDEIVVEALAVFMDCEPSEEVPRAMHALRESLDAPRRERALEGIVAVAEADGILLNRERGIIELLSDVWSLKDAGRRLVERSPAQREGRPEWSLMHDMCLLYIVMAHAPDDEVSERETDAMIDRLRDWEPQLPLEDLEMVLREALALYAEAFDQDVLERSVRAVGESLPLPQQLAVLNDLLFIAETQGPVGPAQRSVLDALSQAWQVPIRLESSPA